MTLCALAGSLKGLSDADVGALQRLVDEQVAENLGMPMIYTIIAAAQEWLRDKVTTPPNCLMCTLLHQNVTMPAGQRDTRCRQPWYTLTSERTKVTYACRVQATPHNCTATACICRPP